MNRHTFLFVASWGLSLVHWGVSTQALAVGNGEPFTLQENSIDANAVNHVVGADSLDFTYHACTPVNGGNLQERGYFWLSSYQDVDSVVDSQLNRVAMQGYHLYGVYRYQAAQVGMAQPAVSGIRLNYLVNNGFIELFTDPNQDTTLSLVNCQVVRTNTNDDVRIGFSNNVAQGEKSETNGLANGDFELVFGQWVWDNGFGNIFNSVNNVPFNFLSFNGNLTLLGGALGQIHHPEGSGNIYWRSNFEPVGN